MLLIPTEILLLFMLVSGLSGFYLKYVLRFDATMWSRVTPLLSILVGTFLASLLRDFGESVVFFTAAVVQFTAFVFVSRLRQRGSFFWHAVASVGSNGAWYATMHIFNGAGAYWLLLLPFISGVVAGRTIGVLWAQYVEKTFELKADAARDERLAPGKRLRLIATEPTFWVLSVSLVGYCLYGLINFEVALRNGLLVVVGLGVLQSLFYAMKTRAVNRGSNTYIVLMETLSGVTFFVNAVYLFSVNLPLELSIPYVLSTVLGSVMGAFFSMIIEWRDNLSPDKHLDVGKKPEIKQSRAPYVILAAGATIWILVSGPLLNLLGFQINSLTFPFPIPGMDVLPRALIMLTVAMIFFLDTALHTVTSRAGNRNHTGYHVSACIPKGVVDFSKMGYLALNSRIPDIVPIAVLVGCLGSLFGKNVSERIEKWLEARMDIVDVKKSANAAVPQK